jgi:hypothetical protein
VNDQILLNTDGNFLFTFPTKFLFSFSSLHDANDMKEGEIIRFDKFENYSCDGTFPSSSFFSPLAKDFVCVISLHDSSKWKMRKEGEIFFYFYYLCYAITSLPHFLSLQPTDFLYSFLFQRGEKYFSNLFTFLLLFAIFLFYF